ncbi:TonB-dependent receptor domain-containing protein [candidate division KSB1 bacterium]
MITDARTGEDLPSVNISLVGTNLGSATDAEGMYFILNVTPGTYTLRASMIGYREVSVNRVKVLSDITVEVSLEMSRTALDIGEKVEVAGVRPIIQKDITSSRQTIETEQISNIPYNNVQNIVALTSGAVMEDGVLHLRGGRNDEIAFLVDGATIVDPWTGVMDSEVPLLALEEISVETGGFTSEYGDALSGVVNMVVKEGGPRLGGEIRVKSSFDTRKNFSVGEQEGSFVDRFRDLEFSLGGPLLPRTNFFIAGELMQDNDRWEGHYSDPRMYLGKLTFRPTTRIKFNLGGFYSRERYHGFSRRNRWGFEGHRWRNYVNEDYNEKYDPDIQGSAFIDGWYGNGQLDTEDRNGNWELDEGEDQNGNNFLDYEDLDYNSRMDIFDMRTHLPYGDDESYQGSLKMTHMISPRTFYKIELNQYTTKTHWETRERINEDRNANGVLDEGEDLNGNAALDPYGVDLYTDTNKNGFVDASEKAFPDSPDQWMNWAEVVSKGQQNADGYYIYGAGNTYNRRSMHYDDRKIYTLKADYTSQVHPNHQIKFGFAAKYHDMFNYDGTDRYGYGERIRIFPNGEAVYFEDKMEFSGLIVRGGFRFDRYDMNWRDWPASTRDPTWNTTDSDWLDRPEGIEDGDIKNPTVVKVKQAFSPRLGVSHPITDRSLLYFSYGRFFQIPIYNHLAQNLNYDMGGGYPRIGNPNLDPQQTTEYEIGVKRQIGESFLLDIKGFYKDITGLVNTNQVFHTVRDWYATYYNLDYGNVRGFEFSLRRMMGRHFFGFVNYTWSVAKGKYSSVYSGYITLWEQNLTPTSEYYLDWDQRHSVAADLQVRLPQDEKFFSIPLTNGTGADLIFSLGSGTRWNYPFGTRRDPLNTETLPYTTTTSLTMFKRFSTWMGDAQLFVEITNLLNRKNVLEITGDDGQGEQWYAADQDGDGNPDHDPDGRWDDPTVYSRPRTIRAGLHFRFGDSAGFAE